MDWLEAAFGFSDEAEQPIAKPAAPPRQAPKVQSCCVVVAQPAHEGDLGEVAEFHFYTDEDQDPADSSLTIRTVMLCTPRGKPTGEEKRLAPGDDPVSVAKRLKRDAWRREKSAERVPGFGRRLSYGTSGLA